MEQIKNIAYFKQLFYEAFCDDWKIAPRYKETDIRQMYNENYTLDEMISWKLRTRLAVKIQEITLGNIKFHELDNGNFPDQVHPQTLRRVVLFLESLKEDTSQWDVLAEWWRNTGSELKEREQENVKKLARLSRTAIIVRDLSQQKFVSPFGFCTDNLGAIEFLCDDDETGQYDGIREWIENHLDIDGRMGIELKYPKFIRVNRAKSRTKICVINP